MTGGAGSLDAQVAHARSLLQGLPGPLGNGEMFAWVIRGGVDSVSRDVFALIEGAGLFERWQPCLPVEAPADPADLMTRLTEVDEAAAIHVLVSLASRTMAYDAAPGRYDEPEAREVFGGLARQLGPGSRWWTNRNLTISSWNPVTRHTFDAVVVGAGRGIIATVLAFDED